MIDPAADFDACFRRTDIDGRAAPTRATLARLVERHAASIPFENINVLCGRVPRSAVVEGRRGD